MTIQLCHQRSVIVVWSAWPSVKSVSGRGESFRLECHGTSAWNMRARTLSLRVQITRSVQPFCCDVYGQVSLRIMPLEERKEHKAWLSNSLPLSVCKLAMKLLNWVRHTNYFVDVIAPYSVRLRDLQSFMKLDGLQWIDKVKCYLTAKSTIMYTHGRTISSPLGQFLQLIFFPS